MKRSESDGDDRTRTVLITGGTSGIGKTAAEGFLKRGWRVFEFSRRAQGLSGTRHFSVDLGDADAISAQVDQVVSEAGRLDALVNNAGCGIFGAAESASEAEIRRQFEVNFFGAVTLTRKVLPIMRAQGGGNIVNIASLAAMFPLPYQSYYSATKAAMMAWSRALGSEVKAFGIKVVSICPGDIRTGFTAARKFDSDEKSVYFSAETQALMRAERSERGGMSEGCVADEIIRFAAGGACPSVAIPGIGYAWLDRLARHLPRTWLDRLIARFY